VIASVSDCFADGGFAVQDGGCRGEECEHHRRGEITTRLAYNGRAEPGEPLSLFGSHGFIVVETSTFVAAANGARRCATRALPLESCYGGLPGGRRLQNATNEPDFYLPYCGDG